MVKFEGEIWQSRARNTQYTKSAFQVPPTGFCDLMDTYYHDNLDADFKDTSNVPQENYCPVLEVIGFHVSKEY